MAHHFPLVAGVDGNESRLPLCDGDNDEDGFDDDGLFIEPGKPGAGE